MPIDQQLYKNSDLRQLALDLYDILQSGAPADPEVIASLDDIVDSLNSIEAAQYDSLSGAGKSVADLLWNDAYEKSTGGSLGWIMDKLSDIYSRLNELKTQTALAASEAHIGQIGGSTVKVQNEFTRPADTNAYAANDIVSNSTSAGTALLLSNAVRINAGTGYIVSARVITNTTGITPRFRLHFGKTAAGAASVMNDNAAAANAYTLLSNSNYLGYMDLAALQSQGGTSVSFVDDNTQRIPISGAAGSKDIYCVVETLDAFAPVSGQKITIQIAIEQN
jgi:hypothetical protein